MQEAFDRITNESGLIINNKKVSYRVFPEKEGVVQAKYSLKLSGTYLKFVSYLETLYSKQMIYKINNISFRVRSLTEIDIKLNLESLYLM